MSKMSTNSDSVVPKNEGGSGEFRPRIERDEPLTTHGHKPGVNVGNDAKPEFSAQALPAGTAPSDRTFEPNILPEAGPGEKSASDTTVGSDSAAVNTGLGKPLQGQTSSELRHDGQHHRKNPGHGLDG